MNRNLCRWAVGLTTVPERFDTTLPRTLNSLKGAGFNNEEDNLRPRLFIDGISENQIPAHLQGYESTCRSPRIRAYGNWLLGLLELYIRNPTAQRYVMFQDDFVTYKNLRQYLEFGSYPHKGYLNLYTFPSNQTICPTDKGGQQMQGWYLSNQYGRGAVALIFGNDAVRTLLCHQDDVHLKGYPEKTPPEHLIEKPQDTHRGHKRIDGAIISAMIKAGYKEYVHNPSLTQHIGEESTVGNLQHPQAVSFMGEDYDLMDWIHA